MISAILFRFPAMRSHFCGIIRQTKVSNKKERDRRQCQSPTYHFPECGDGLEPLLRRYGKFLASVTTACLQDAASVWCRHALTETVLVNALAHRWLECSFHYFTFLYYSVFTNRTANLDYFWLKYKIFSKNLSRRGHIARSLRRPGRLTRPKLGLMQLSGPRIMAIFADCYRAGLAH